jgi:hypothetical protein
MGYDVPVAPDDYPFAREDVDPPSTRSGPTAGGYEPEHLPTREAPPAPSYVPPIAAQAARNDGPIAQDGRPSQEWHRQGTTPAHWPSYEPQHVIERPARTPVIAQPVVVAEAPVPPETPPPQRVAAPVAQPVAAPSSEPSATAIPPETVATAQSHAPASNKALPPVLHWLMLIVAAALVFQVVQLSLRPLRRALALRHLRHPFWTETVDQRVSNSWHLALIGLRDAGWRASSSESPRDFAQRAGVEGLERCATILERARHGIGIDADDLSTMSTSADTAYRSARAGISPIARVVAAIRWPLT